ncbi:MAG: phosphatidylinositol kinase [Fibrobacter sp.]|nr:phosphatidylinositol kinase [Fibrobacter sp.]
MSNKGLVYYNKVLAGTIEYRDKEYIFTYDLSYFSNQSMPSIAISLPKKKAEYRSPVLFPFFYGLLAEGDEKALQCSALKIDENDHFTRLLKTTAGDTIGAVTVREAP